MTTAQEARIGRQEYPQVLQAFGGIYPDPTLQSYIRRLGQSLARKMAFEYYRVERFRVLNGFAPGAKVHSGQRVKIVSE